ncbi:MAG: LLM class flavin-dependent oxidoreductase [Candidatus Binatia bacterium]
MPIHFNAFTQCSAALQSFGQWKNPRERTPRGYTDVGFWIELAQLLERGCFDSLFFADVHGVYDVYQGKPDAGIKHAVQFPGNDPTLLLPALAQATRSLGFIVTYSTTYYPPYHTAKLFSSLDHFTTGRVGWNIVTSYLPSAYRNGMGQLLPHDERYDRAEEYLEVLYKLWEQSWEEDAVVSDSTRDIYIDPAKVHPIDHHGSYFDIQGPHMCEPSPQRTPLLVQAGQSKRGTAFGAKHGEALFVSYPNVETAKIHTARIRDLIAANGRDPRHVKLLAEVAIIVAETEHEARLKEQHLRDYANAEGAFALYGGWTGVDLGQLHAPDVLENIPSQGIQNVARWFVKMDPTRVWTLKEVGEAMKLAGTAVLLIGDPLHIVDELERWVDEGGVDGFNLVPIYQPGSHTEFIDLVVPELQRRGRMRTCYEGATLREHFFGAGQRRLVIDHCGSRYRRTK